MISVPLSIAEYQCTCAKIHDSIETVCDSWVTKRTYSAHYAVGAAACSTGVVEAIGPLSSAYLAPPRPWNNPGARFLVREFPDMTRKFSSQTIRHACAT